VGKSEEIETRVVCVVCVTAAEWSNKELIYFYLLFRGGCSPDLLRALFTNILKGERKEKKRTHEEIHWTDLFTFYKKNRKDNSTT